MASRHPHHDAGLRPHAAACPLFRQAAFEVRPRHRRHGNVVNNVYKMPRHTSSPAISRCKTGHFATQDRPFRTAKRAVSRPKTTQSANRLKANHLHRAPRVRRKSGAHCEKSLQRYESPKQERHTTDGGDDSRQQRIIHTIHRDPRGESRPTGATRRRNRNGQTHTWRTEKCEAGADCQALNASNSHHGIVLLAHQNIIRG